MARVLVNVPKTAKRGDIVEIKAMIAHPMETGHRQRADGTSFPRQIINRFVCTYDGETIFAADLFPAVSANPYLAFSTVATASGKLTFAWTDDDGATQTASAEIVVT
jgi:sulfur-oxidizing protein SoxZ